MRFLVSLLFLLLFPLGAFLKAQDSFTPSKKSSTALRIDSKIKIDGLLDEADWSQAKVLTNFIQEEPNPGVASSQRTEVYVLYDNAALYIGAKLYDISKDSILRQLTLRDGRDVGGGRPFGSANTDWFGIALDTYKDGINGFSFVVSAAGVQLDMKILGDDTDTNWDAVWDSNVKLYDDHWIVEMKIPYAAIRFSEKETQSWHLNIGRSIRRNREIAWWNPINPNVDGYFTQAGVLEGLKDIKAPIRLQATPYVAGYYENYNDPNGSNSNSYSLTGGMDIKYGINDAYTLDMTLIPDFGEVVSDNQVLNLSPFEVRFDENRPFFTEGTELFNKGGLFYSRRIGGQPINFFKVYSEIQEGETLVANPSETQLINATKVSGRGDSGLGVGVFNAIASAQEAIIENELGDRRTFQTAPLTNYNVLVFDQNLPNNSFINIINTNVMRQGETYDANVTGTSFGIRNKNNTYGIEGQAAISQKYFSAAAADFGHKLSLSLGKISGKYTFNASYNEESDNYDPNDLGFLFSPNERSFRVQANYNNFEPKGKILRRGLNVFGGHERLQSPDAPVSTWFGMNGWMMTKKFFAFGGWTNFRPIRGRDYFEPRTFDFESYRLGPLRANGGAWISSDYRKRAAIDVQSGLYLTDEDGRWGWDLEIEPRFRVNDRLTIIASNRNELMYVDNGWVNFDENGNSIFGLRNRVTMINRLSANYIFNDLMGVTFRMRHYWTKVNYQEQFYSLLKDGNLGASDYTGNHNQSFNAFTIDLVYRWRFAPGSDLVFTWKNSIFNSDEEDTRVSYFQNMGKLLDAPQTNSFSLKVIYFLDYYDISQRMKNS